MNFMDLLNIYWSIVSILNLYCLVLSSFTLKLTTIVTHRRYLVQLHETYEHV